MKKVKHIVAYLLSELFNASCIFSPKGTCAAVRGEREWTDLHYRALVASKLRRRRRLIYSCELTNLA